MSMLSENVSETEAAVEEVVDSTDRGVAEISQFRLMARRFKKSKLSVFALIVLAIMYVIMLFAPFFMVNQAFEISSDAKNAPPSKLTFDGGLKMCRPAQVLDQATLSYKYTSNCSDKNSLVPVHVFGKGYKYKMWGVLPTTRHILAVDAPNKLYLWGADTQGRDVYSRTVIGSRVSLTIGIVSVLVGTIVAAILGTVSGYFGGAADNIIQRIAEIIMSIPTLPLWMVLAAILPKNLSVTERYLLISLILVATSWPGLARQVRAKTMTFARADFVNAAKAAGSGTNRIILTHLMPNTISHLVVVACLGIPGTIAAETSLSFLGIGMQEPAVSWGVLLQAAQDMSVINSFQWILIPGLLVIIAVTMFQLIGDGLRDAVDPYS
jgi:peptide/nickel transport system permease protein